MNRIQEILYRIVPIGWRKKLGRNKILKPIRDNLLRKGGTYREITTHVKREYPPYTVAFDISASIQVAVKAEKKGMENTLLRNSITLLRQRIKDDSAVVIDVGTNFGYLSLVWLKSIAKHGEVHSFEPHPLMYNSLLKSHQFNSCTNWFIVNKAVGSMNKEIELHTTNTSSNTLPMNHKESKEGQIVPMITLDTYARENSINRCDLLKVDVDGIEWSILNGAKEFIMNCKPIVITETNDDGRIIPLMEELGYLTYDMALKPIEDGDPLPPNTFFVPSL